MIALDTLLDNPHLGLQTYLDECLSSCIDCQYSMAAFKQSAKDVPGREDIIWPMLCVTHSPWIRAKQDPTYLPSVRREIAILTAKLASMPSFEDIVGRMDNGYDMLERQKINAERFQTRFAELEATRRERVEAEEDLAYWKTIQGYAATDEFRSNEGENAD